MVGSKSGDLPKTDRRQEEIGARSCTIDQQEPCALQIFHGPTEHRSWTESWCPTRHPKIFKPCFVLGVQIFVLPWWICIRACRHNSSSRTECAREITAFRAECWPMLSGECELAHHRACCPTLATWRSLTRSNAPIPSTDTKVSSWVHIGLVWCGRFLDLFRDLLGDGACDQCH